MARLNLPKEATFKGPALIWKRMVAFMLDIIILDFVIGFPLRKVMTKVVPVNDFSGSYTYFLANPKATAILTVIIIFYGMLVMLYFAILEYHTGQTVGKIFTNIKVESDKKEISFFACLIRNMYFIFIFPFILLWVIDPLFMLFTKEKRRLSEILSGTRTVEVYSLNG